MRPVHKLINKRLQNASSDFFFFFLSIIQVRLVIFSLAAEFKKGPSGVMSKKRGTLLQLPTQLITYSALTVSSAAQFSFPNWPCFVEVKKFAHLDAPRKCGRISNPTLPLPYRRTHFFSTCCVSPGHVALTDTEGQTETSEDVPFYVKESWSLSGREVRGGFEGRWGAALRQAKLNLHPTLYACLHSPAMHSAGGRQNLSPSSGNYSELVRHVWYPGMHLPFIRCVCIGDSKGDGRKIILMCF